MHHRLFRLGLLEEPPRVAGRRMIPCSTVPPDLCLILEVGSAP
jgi:hypothetical protein